MKLTIRTNLAMRTLMFCAANPGRTVRKQEVATACNASENHLSQVIHKLAKAGFITTVRGRSGGLLLRRDPAGLPVGEVVRWFESSVALTECLSADRGNCPLVASCLLTCAFSDALKAFYDSLDRVTLADLVHNNTGLKALLKVA
ncbi:Rrf2 family transcriptional regulator [Pseudorhodobacter sp.]|uniref:RrF2 family transcriptional regulator n=1 Tax=Pseudorhodobacter sp. TaxID=1934400 RepID=UPI002B00357B|nr:Rrf2 family transcriptional regulator [Pseudorhodobacter sp.]